MSLLSSKIWRSDQNGFANSSKETVFQNWKIYHFRASLNSCLRPVRSAEMVSVPVEKHPEQHFGIICNYIFFASRRYRKKIQKIVFFSFFNFVATFLISRGVDKVLLLLLKCIEKMVCWSSFSNCWLRAIRYNSFLIMWNDFAGNGLFPSLYCFLQLIAGLWGNLDSEILFWIQNTTTNTSKIVSQVVQWTVQTAKRGHISAQIKKLLSLLAPYEISVTSGAQLWQTKKSRIYFWGVKYISGTFIWNFSKSI